MRARTLHRHGPLGRHRADRAADAHQPVIIAHPQGPLQFVGIDTGGVCLEQ